MNPSCPHLSKVVNIYYHRCMSIEIPVLIGRADSALATGDAASEQEPSASAVCCAPLVREPLGADEADDFAKTMKALADPTRLRLLSIVAATAEKEACVCDLTEPVGLSQPTVSHHLKILTDAGFLARSKRGTWAYYSLVPGSLERVADVLNP